LRHELAHLEDILDPAFGYTESPLAGPDAIIVRQRYSVLWSIACAARLVRQGRSGNDDQTEAFRRFEIGYRKLSVADRSNAFRAIWERPRWTHAELMALAIDPVAGAHVRRGSIPGGPCPLCAFPTHAWIVPGIRLTPALIAVIQKEYPAWRAEDGLCDRCVEYSEVKAGTWWVQAS
jgi:hypothetical protein